MMRKAIPALVAGLFMFSAAAQEAAPTAFMDALQRGDTAGMSPQVVNALRSAQQSAEVAADLDALPEDIVQFSQEQAAQLTRKAREAYVAALPPRDQARGASVLLGDGTVADSPGKLYFFVSKSMPRSLLRAYARDALFLNASLVVKGLRKGETIKEYVEEAMENFNSADGQVLAGLELNPNLFDIFNVTVVPAVVWTNRLGLDDIGSGCENLPEDVPVPTVTFEGPDGSPMELEKPVCAQAPATSYYKIAGALNPNYVLDKFEEAGAPKAAMDAYRAVLATRHGNVHEGHENADNGNAISPINGELHIDALPPAVLTYWQEELASKKVARGVYGPAFGDDVEEDAAYRQELSEKIRRGLALTE